ncbi:MAG TPA: Flp pilus assembly protein CpaB [Caulobacteraceae bacterium]|jgi:pilus assembly protein CpaB|nr:Flp pilus assembly protein CpaB [Caulobacteraceae bacterium]
MSLRTIATIAIAIMLGLVAVFLVRGYITNPKTGPATQAQAQAYATVVVASKPIDRGEALAAAALKVVPFPAASIPPGAFHTVNEIVSGPNARLALRSIALNEPILTERISGPGAKPNLSAELTAGMRAVSLRSNDVSGVGGFVLPGDRVDIFLTRSLTGADNRTTTVTQALAQNVRVLGVDQSSNEDSNKPVVAKAVTVEVSPDQAQAILLGDSVGTVSMSLRQISDAAALNRRVTTVADLGVFGPRPLTHRPVRHRAPKGMMAPLTVSVVRGVDSATYSLSH